MKNKIVYTIQTVYGGWYKTDKDGNVLKCNNGLDKTEASKTNISSWRITGLREVKAFNNLGRLIPLAEAVKLTDILRKNRRPRYCIEDIDHGTTRIHGNYKYHGVGFISLIK